MKIVIDDKIPFIKGVFEPYGEVLYLPGDKITRANLFDADALVTRTRTICNKELLEGTSVKFIATATIGFDHIDTAYCNENGIIWKNAPGCNSGSVMQYVASVLASLAIKNNFNFSDRTLGVVGVGNVGKKIVRLAEALGMRVVMNDPPVMRRGSCGFISLEGILREADIISIHTPLTFEGEDKTFHLFNSRIFEKMNPKTILINTSRGEVVDTADIKNAFKNNRFQALAMDVWENEPDIDLELMKMCEIATPHIAGYALDGKANGTQMSVRAISAFFRLGLENWKPEFIPSPANPIIDIDTNSYTLQEALRTAILHTYDVFKENSFLNNNPKKFEFHRGNYPPHREFQAYTVKLKNSSTEYFQAFKMLGFNIDKA